MVNGSPTERERRDVSGEIKGKLLILIFGIYKNVLFFFIIKKKKKIKEKSHWNNIFFIWIVINKNQAIILSCVCVSV